MKVCPVHCGIFSIILRESFPRQVDKKSRGPQGERGLEFSRRKKGQTFFPSLHSLGLYNNNVLCLRTVSGLNLLANSVNYGSRPALYKDYIATMYYVFCLRTVSGLNLLANSVILQCKLGSRSDEVFTTSRHSFDLLESI